MLFVIKSSFLILSPVFFSLFFLRDCQSFQMRDANFLSRVILVVVSSFEAFWNSSWSTFTHSKLPKNITTCHLQRVLEYGLPYKGLFTFCRWMITNLLHNSRCHCTVAKQDLHLPTSSLLIQPSTLAMNFVIFYTTGILFLCLTASVFAVVQGDAIWIHLVLLQKADH